VRQRIKAYIFAGMFLGMMILPGLLFIPLKDYVDTENYENRVYQEKPVLNFRNLSAADLKSYPGQYDAYFNDHLAFKNPIVAFGKLAFMCLGKSRPMPFLWERTDGCSIS